MECRKGSLTNSQLRAAKQVPMVRWHEMHRTLAMPSEFMLQKISLCAAPSQTELGFWRELWHFEQRLQVFFILTLIAFLKLPQSGERTRAFISATVSVFTLPSLNWNACLFVFGQGWVLRAMQLAFSRINSVARHVTYAYAVFKLRQEFAFKWHTHWNFLALI